MQILTRAALAACTVVAMPVFGLAATVVTPNAQATALGNGQDNDRRIFPAAGDTDGQRFQQIYDAGQFSTLGASENITAIAFRAKVGGFFFPGIFGDSVTVSNINIRLSTTNRNSSIDGANNISNVFADNVGADIKTVYSGALTVTTPTANDTNFGYVINLQMPFTYSKGNGNLLLDITIPAGATTTNTGSSGYSPLDTQTGDALGANANDGVASAFGSTAAGTIGSNTTTGIVTQFTTVVPEPASVGLLAGAALLGLRRRRA